MNKGKKLINGHYYFNRERLVPWFLLIGSVGLSLGVDLSRRIIEVQAVEGVEQTETFHTEVEDIDIAPTPSPTPIKSAKVTAYSCGGLETREDILMNCPSLLSGGPRTATGTRPIPNQTIACDRANLGKKFLIEKIGVVTCTDTGGAIKGPGRFDLYLETVQEARQFGVQNLSYKEVK